MQSHLNLNMQSNWCKDKEWVGLKTNDKPTNIRRTRITHLYWIHQSGELRVMWLARSRDCALGGAHQPVCRCVVSEWLPRAGNWCSEFHRGIVANTYIHICRHDYEPMQSCHYLPSINICSCVLLKEQYTLAFSLSVRSEVTGAFCICLCMCINLAHTRITTFTIFVNNILYFAKRLVI